MNMIYESVTNLNSLIQCISLYIQSLIAVSEVSCWCIRSSYGGGSVAFEICPVSVSGGVISTSGYLCLGFGACGLSFLSCEVVLLG